MDTTLQTKQTEHSLFSDMITFNRSFGSISSIPEMIAKDSAYTAEAIASFLTTNHQPDHRRRLDDSAWSYAMESLFNVMIAKGASFEAALKVFEDLEFRSHIRPRRASIGRLMELFKSQPLGVQFNQIEKRILERGAEGSDSIYGSILRDMVSYVDVPRDSKAEHLRRVMSWALARDFHDPKRDAESFLTMIRLIKTSLSY